jgi:hypothetical protein
MRRRTGSTRHCGAVGTTYEVRVLGQVPDEVLQQLGDVTVTEQETRTLVIGSFCDQAELHGFLNRLRAYGLDLVELRALTPPDEAES